jgi:hypothetical protein
MLSHDLDMLEIQTQLHSSSRRDLVATTSYYDVHAPYNKLLHGIIYSFQFSS